MILAELPLFQKHHLVVKEWLPDGQTKSGIHLEYAESLPRMFGTAINLGVDAIAEGLQVGDSVVFPRYAGEPYNHGEERYHIFNIADIEATWRGELEL